LLAIWRTRIAKISHQTIREKVLSRISSSSSNAQQNTSAEQNIREERIRQSREGEETINLSFQRPEPYYLSSIIEATNSAHDLQPNISSKQTYWSCEDYEEDLSLPTSSKHHHSHLQKYSSASTVDLDEHQQQQPIELNKHHFDQLVHKYNLYAYVQTEYTSGYPPLPNYAESTQHSDATTDSLSNRQQREMSNLPSQPQYAENPSLETVKKICGIPARLTGFFSLVVQTIVMLVALALTVLMFYQLGGFKILNSTLTHSASNNETSILFPTPTMLEITNILANSTEMVTNIFFIEK
jgi:hypothetical protein